jgi:membrane fusion protein (multidrug efflux system)
VGVGVLAGCKAAPTIAPASDKVEVGVVELTAQPVMQQRELPGRTAPYRVAEVRARVNGIVLSRLFKEGSDVTEGQALYRIDRLPYQAALNSALATLARAQASAETSGQQADRSSKMLETGLASQQSHDTLIGAQKVAMAEVAGGKAAVEIARINLGYTNVVAPIAGRVGRSEVSEGAYVQQSQATLMATVQQLDPIYVDLTQSSTELLRLKRQLESGQLVRSGDGARVNLLLEDGTVYAEAGSLQFSDVTVNPSTGSITVRALFPNPKRELLPGMFVRARLEDGTTPDAILVRQSAVRRDAQGKASVLVVGADDKVELRAVEAPQAVGDKWRVTEGLSVGDRVIVEGLQKVRPGSVVTAVPAAGETAKHGPS